MSDYTNLLRMLKTYEDGYGLYQDAATAIEELIAQVKDKDYLIQQQTDEIKRLRRDVKKQQEKMFDLAKKLPKQGEWKTTRPDAPMFGFYYCSICGRKRTSPQDNYCPNCGAKMDGEVEHG